MNSVPVNTAYGVPHFRKTLIARLRPLPRIPCEPKETVPVTEILGEVANECFQLIEGW